MPQKKKIFSLFTRASPFVSSGDFNVHRDLWESHVNVNRGGILILTVTMELPDVSLLTPIDFGKRIYLSTGKPLTIDRILYGPLSRHELN